MLESFFRQSYCYLMRVFVSISDIRLNFKLLESNSFREIVLYLWHVDCFYSLESSDYRNLSMQC